MQQHFQSCGTVNRVTILTDKFGQPKGFAYVEFLEIEAVQEALQLNESELHGRQLKVTDYPEVDFILFLFVFVYTQVYFIFIQVLAKRTNVPGMKQFRPRRFNPYMGYRFRRPYVPPYFYSPYGYGLVVEFCWDDFLLSCMFYLDINWQTKHTYCFSRKVPRFRRPMRYRPYF